MMCVSNTDKREENRAEKSFHKEKLRGQTDPGAMEWNGNYLASSSTLPESCFEVSSVVFGGPALGISARMKKP